ncbi:putative 5'3'-deoxyribonucleotidase [Xanthomonas phage XbC2]|nr:putative 5'3'-deoxyribonucleotidase [Xanthomonas phage XbC2]
MPYGYCPKCGAEGVSAARNPVGPTICANGHEYPHAQRQSTPEPLPVLSGAKRSLRIYVDMDGVIADFEANLKGRNPKSVKLMPGTYIRLDPIQGALEAVRTLIAAGHDVWIATKTPTHNLLADSEKKHWINEYIPELLDKTIITPDKGCLRGDVLIDDRPHKANCESFEGTFIHFGSEEFPTWDEVLKHIEGI